MTRLWRLLLLIALGLAAHSWWLSYQTRLLVRQNITTTLSAVSLIEDLNAEMHAIVPFPWYAHIVGAQRPPKGRD